MTGRAAASRRLSKRNDMKIHTGLLITILAFGCGGEEAAEEATEAVDEAAETAEAASAEAAEAAETAEAAEAAAAAATANAEAGNPGAAAQQGLQALGQMMAAAQEAEGGTPCETAYNASIAMLESLRKNMPAGQAPPSDDEIPTKEVFVERCSQLPPEAQQCLTMTYAMANQAECQALMNSPEVQAFRNSMRPE